MGLQTNQHEQLPSLIPRMLLTRLSTGSALSARIQHTSYFVSGETVRWTMTGGPRSSSAPHTGTGRVRGQRPGVRCTVSGTAERSDSEGEPPGPRGSRRPCWEWRGRLNSQDPAGRIMPSSRDNYCELLTGLCPILLKDVVITAFPLEM